MKSVRRINPNIEIGVLVARHSKARRIRPLAEVKTGATQKLKGPHVPALTRFGVTSGGRTYQYATDGSIRRTDAGAGVRGKAAKKAEKRLRVHRIH